MTSDEPRNEAEFLARESQFARDALVRLRGEMIESLGRTADINAWTVHYPWASLGTAATAGIVSGWALGRTFRRSPRGETNAEASVSSAETVGDAAAGASHPASRLISGLGTLAGMLASTVATSAAEALSDVVKNTIRDSLHPTPPDTDATSNPDAESADDES